jgi:hypothetical protein
MQIYTSAVNGAHVINIRGIIKTLSRKSKHYVFKTTLLRCTDSCQHFHFYFSFHKL